MQHVRVRGLGLSGSWVGVGTLHSCTLVLLRGFGIQQTFHSFLMRLSTARLTSRPRGISGRGCARTVPARTSDQCYGDDFHRHHCPHHTSPTVTTTAASSVTGTATAAIATSATNAITAATSITALLLPLVLPLILLLVRPKPKTLNPNPRSPEHRGAKPLEHYIVYYVISCYVLLYGFISYHVVLFFVILIAL